MKNPYAWNTINPELCYGRDKLLSELLSGLPGSPRYSFGLAGGRRMGKTTLLRRVERDLRAGVDQWQAGGLLVIPIYVDGLVLPRPLAAADVWAYLLRELQFALPGQPLQPSGQLDFNVFKETIKPMLPNLPERPRIIIMFDEIEPIVVCDWAYGFLGQWRALLSNTPDLSEYLTAVFAGAQEMASLQRDVGSPLKDILEWRNLHALDYEDAGRLMQEPIGLEWPATFLQRAYGETGGHPIWYRLYGTLAESPRHDPELYARLARVGTDLADKYLSAWKIYQADLPNYSGAIGEMRDTITLLLDKIAPDEQVSAEAGFRFEPGQKKPTRRQRVRYAALKRYNTEHTKEIASDFDLLETSCDQLAQIVTGAYRGASGLTHTTATRERAYRVLKQWDSILAQLLPDT